MDLRALKKRHERQNLFLVVTGLIVIGSGLIGLIYGRTAFWVSLACLMTGALLILLIYGVLFLLEVITGSD